MHRWQRLAVNDKPYSLHHCLGLAGGVVGSEVLVLLHLLLHGEHLRLELVTHCRECVADVVGQLLVELALQVRRTHPISHVPDRYRGKIVCTCNMIVTKGFYGGVFPCVWKVNRSNCM